MGRFGPTRGASAVVLLLLSAAGAASDSRSVCFNYIAECQAAQRSAKIPALVDRAVHDYRRCKTWEERAHALGFDDAKCGVLLYGQAKNLAVNEPTRELGIGLPPVVAKSESAASQARVRDRIAVEAQRCDWDLKWQQYSNFRQCADAANATARTLTNRCMEAADRQVDYYRQSGRPREEIGAQLRKEDCALRFADKHRACTAFCRLEFGSR